MRSKPPDPISPRLVDQHARVVLPKEVLRALRLERGDHVHFTVKPEGTVEVRRVHLSLE